MPLLVFVPMAMQPAITVLLSIPNKANSKPGCCNKFKTAQTAVRMSVTPTGAGLCPAAPRYNVGKKYK
jgi:hypothetical protein